MKNESWLEDSLKILREQHLEREIHTRRSPARLDFSTNDYLALSRHPAVTAAAAKALCDFGSGSTASRLVSGSLPIHDELEQQIAAHKGYPSALIFGSGYLANIGVLPTLVGRGDDVFADRLIHASLVDAIQLSRARLRRFHHNDIGHLAELLARCPATGKRLVITESVFSMDGDLAPLPEIAAIAEHYEAMLMVDEAHALGVFGPSGAGLVAQHKLQSKVHVVMSTLSKAIGSYGATVACSDKLRSLLVHRARSLIYSTAPAPATIGAALGALEVMRTQPDMGRELLARADRLRTRLNELGFDTRPSASQIIPIRIGENEVALAFAERLRARGLRAIAIRPPTVPPGTARIRLSVTLAHAEADIDEAANTIKACRA